MCPGDGLTACKLVSRTYFCGKSIPQHGTKKKEQRQVLVSVFPLPHPAHFHHLHALALAYIGDAFRVYQFCVCNGYNLTADFWD